jgi:carbon storage regulator
VSPACKTDLHVICIGFLRPLAQEGASVMLVLSRQRDETIIIGDNIEVTVVDIRGDKVRLGITAPKDISVHRKEVYEDEHPLDRYFQ